VAHAGQAGRVVTTGLSFLATQDSELHL